MNDQSEKIRSLMSISKSGKKLLDGAVSGEVEVREGNGGGNPYDLSENGSPEWLVFWDQDHFCYIDTCYRGGCKNFVGNVDGDRLLGTYEYTALDSSNGVLVYEGELTERGRPPLGKAAPLRERLAKRRLACNA